MTSSLAAGTGSTARMSPIDPVHLRVKLGLHDHPLWLYLPKDSLCGRSTDSPSFVKHLFDEWSKNFFNIPESCILSRHVPTMDYSCIAESADLFINMSHIQLAPLRQWLRPLSRADMWLDTRRKGSWCPTFTLQPHAAGASRINGGRGLDAYSVETAIEPTLVRMLDVIRSDGDVFPIVQAIQNLFSGLPNCGLRLNPNMSFPWFHGPPTATRALGSFALVPQYICPTLPQTMKKTLASPATVLDPVIFLGIADVTNGDDVCSADQQIISNAIQPHLEALIIALQTHCTKKGCRDVKLPAALPEWAVVFAIVIRRGALYVVSHTPSWKEGGWQFRSDIVDRIPVPVHMDTADDIRQRMKLAMALLTLQRHVCVLSTVFEDILWPPNLIDERQRIRDTHTGIRSPCPSDGLSRESETNPNYDLFLRQDDETEELQRKQLLEDAKKSVLRVTAWLKRLPARVPSPSANLDVFDIGTPNVLEPVQPIFSLTGTRVLPPVINSHRTNGFSFLNAEDCMLHPDKTSVRYIKPSSPRHIIDRSTSSVVQVLDDSEEKWFLMKARGLVRIPDSYRLDPGMPVDISGIDDPDAVRTATLKIFFRTLDDCAYKRWRLPSRVQWVHPSKADIAPWPEPDFSFLYPTHQADGRTSPLTRIFFNLLRFPRYFEGGPEYGVDSCIKDALIHIFDLPNVVFQPEEEHDCLVPLGLDVPGWRDRVSAERPALVINFEKNPSNARRALARAALPGVGHLLHKYYELNGYSTDRITQRDRDGGWLPMEAQPDHHFVYGICCAESQWSVYAHFAVLEMDPDAGIRSWHYHQILITKLSTDFPPIGGPYDWRPPLVNVMLQRWRLIVVLFAIRRHVIYLNESGPRAGFHDPKENNS